MLPPLLTLLALAVAPSHGPAVPQDLPEPAATQDRPELRFVDLDEARARAAVDGRPIALVFRAIWCGACAELEQDTLPSRLVQDRGDDAHWVLVDVDRQQALSHDYGVDSTPHLVIEAADGALLGRARGYLTPQELVAFLDDATGQDAGEEPAWLESPLKGELVWTPRGYRSHAICFSHVGYGPLALPSQAPGQVLRLGLVPRTPSTLAAGDVEVQGTASLANIWSYKEGSYRLDYATLSSVLSVAYGLSDELQVELGYADLSRFDSVLDPITTAFHDAFGFGDAGRDEFPEGDNALYLAGTGGAADVTNRTVGSLSRDLSLTLQHNLTCGSDAWPAVSYAVTARHHTGGKAYLRGSSPWSLGLTGSASRRLSDEVYGYLGLSHTWHGMDRWENLELREQQSAGLLAFEWRYRTDSSWVAQYLISEGVARDRDPFDRPAHEISLGWKKELEHGLVLELGLIENAVVADNSPDFGLHVGLRRRF